MKRLIICLLLIGIAGCGPDAEIEEIKRLEEQAKRAFDRRQEQENEWEQEVADRLVAGLTEQAAILALGIFEGAFGEDEDGNVSEIDLSGTQITDAALVHLKELKKLESLRLTDTKITDAGLVHLKGLTKLRYLNLSDTQVTNAGVADLQKALSDCEILDAAGQRTEQPTKQPTELAIKSITNTIGMTLNEIPAGTFMMGSPEGEGKRENAETQHKVTISKAFYMQTTEVTQSQWKALMNTEPWKGKQSHPSIGTSVKEGPNYPASYVNWDNAVEFCKKLSAKEGKKYRLPTEAEWEYGCRAGAKTTWSFGNDKKTLGDYAWYEANAVESPEQYAHQVGLKKPNAWGLYDMHGNLFEWCHDYFGKDYYKQSPEKDPTGLAETTTGLRVLRGGSWYHGPHLARSGFRFAERAAGYALKYYPHGFRLVRELD